MKNQPGFFDFAAEVGLTKHIGGIEATETLVALCHIGKNKYILDVGCGVGVTPCYLVKKYGCRVVGVDISEKMVERSRERAQREKLADRIEFRVADAQKLPFEDAVFDAVITESVTAFPKDKLVYTLLQEMWQRNLGVTIQKSWDDPATMKFETRQDFHFFFIGWFADYPDPASFLQTNLLLHQSHWQNSTFETLVDEGRRSLDLDRRVELYRQADRVLTHEAVILPLFYGQIYQLRQPWVHKPAGASIYGPQWKDITLLPH